MRGGASGTRCRRSERLPEAMSGGGGRVARESAAWAGRREQPIGQRLLAAGVLRHGRGGTTASVLMTLGGLAKKDTFELGIQDPTDSSKCEMITSIGIGFVEVTVQFSMRREFKGGPYVGE